MWLAFSSRPLEPEELADVVTVDFSSNGLPSYDPDLRYFGTADMLITCSGFVAETEGTLKQPCVNAAVAHLLWRGEDRPVQLHENYKSSQARPYVCQGLPRFRSYQSRGGIIF